MWGELKGIGGFLFTIGCIITWVAFLVPYVKPDLISNPYQLWQWGAVLVVVGIGVFGVAWGLDKLGWARFKLAQPHYGRTRKAMRAAKFAAGGLVLLVAVWGLVTYGPGVARWVGEQTGGAGGSVLSVREVSEHSGQYYGKTITIKGKVWSSSFTAENVYVGLFYQIYPEDAPTQTWFVGFENAPATSYITQGSFYQMTGILYPSLAYPILDVKSVTPA